MPTTRLRPVRGWAKHYLWSRTARIFIPYLPIGIGTALLFTVRPALAAYDWNWFSSLTLLPGASPPALAIAWTLQHEVIFYALMLVLLPRDRVLLGCAAWICTIACTHLFTTSDIPGLNLIDIEFSFGIFAAYLHLNRIRLPLPVAIAAGIVTLIAPALQWTEARLGFAAGLSLVIAAALSLNRPSHPRLSAALLFLGNASYALYLSHVPVFRVANRILAALPGPLLLPILILAALAAGSLFHLLWERPMLLASRRLLRSAQSKLSDDSLDAPAEWMEKDAGNEPVGRKNDGSPFK